MQPDSAGADVGERPDARLVDPDRRVLRRASRRTTSQTINNALAHGQNLILTPGVYHLDRTIKVKRPDTVVLGLGFPTLVPENGVVADGPSPTSPASRSPALIFDAGPVNSPVLLAGRHPGKRTRAIRPTRPSLRTSSSASAAPSPGKATTSLVVNSDNVILDDIWAWRADHGTGVGWTANTADTGVVVNGDDVTAYGLFVEHYQKYEVIWNGENGQGRLLPERDAVRPAEPGGVDGGPRRRRATRPSRSPTT